MTECAIWTDAESQKAMAFLKKSIPLIPVEFDADDDVGIYIGVGNEFVKIEKEYINKAGEILYKKVGKSTFYRPSETDDNVEYDGKVYTGFQLVAGHCVLIGTYRTVLAAVKAAISVYHGFVAIKHELGLPISDASAKEFSLR
jgi:hypothetical protein